MKAAMNRTQFSIAVLVLLCLPANARAERPPQDCNEAPIALTGTVEFIDQGWSPETDYYYVEVHVETVERGPTIRTGDRFVVSCFRWSLRKKGVVGASGHRSIPTVGDRIRLFAWPRGWRHEGNYPNWYDVLEPSQRPWLARQFRYRMFRSACHFAAIITVVVVWGIWMKRREARAAKNETAVRVFK